MGEVPLANRNVLNIFFVRGGILNADRSMICPYEKGIDHTIIEFILPVIMKRKNG